LSSCGLGAPFLVAWIISEVLLMPFATARLFCQVTRLV